MDFIKNLIPKWIKRKQPVNVVSKIIPNSWGIVEYNGMQYRFVKGQKNNPKKELYNNFIADVVRRLDKITIRKDNFICQNC